MQLSISCIWKDLITLLIKKKSRFQHIDRKVKTRLLFIHNMGPYGACPIYKLEKGHACVISTLLYNQAHWKFLSTFLDFRNTPLKIHIYRNLCTKAQVPIGAFGGHWYYLMPLHMLFWFSFSGNVVLCSPLSSLVISPWKSITEVSHFHNVPLRRISKVNQIHYYITLLSHPSNLISFQTVYFALI